MPYMSSEKEPVRPQHQFAVAERRDDDWSTLLGRTVHCFVVEGDLRVAGAHLHAGDYHAAMAGSTHETIRSDTGCLPLIVEAHA